MAAENKHHSGGTSTTSKNKKRKQYLAHNKPVKRKGWYPLRPGVQGFFITCDGGRERQASHEAVNVIDSFFDELVNGTGAKLSGLLNNPQNKKTKFSDSDSSSDEEDDEEGESGVVGKENNTTSCKTSDIQECPISGMPYSLDSKNQLGDRETEDLVGNDKPLKLQETEEHETECPPAKKHCIDIDSTNRETKSIDKLIEDELKELGDRNKRRFVNLDAGCNGLVFVQMHKREGDPSPKDIAQHMMTSAASTRKHMSRFILRLLPIEVACYASEEEISKAIQPLVSKYFSVETTTTKMFAVLYEARANTGIDRMKIIDSVAKAVPPPHKVDLKNPDITIVVQVVKTICLIGIVEKYKELAKYNLRQLTS